MKEKLNNYFTQKKIYCFIKENVTNDFTTFTILLENINDFKKFNDTMKKELIYVLKTNVSINVSDKIEIVINTRDNNKASNVNELCVPLGTKTDGSLLYVDFKNNPHWLIGGSTGSGKSVFLNNVIMSLIENYQEKIQFGFIDLKKTELRKYNNLYMNLMDVATDLDKAKQLLFGLIGIMNERYDMFESHNVNSIFEYNKQFELKEKYIILVIDELAELLLQGDSDIQEMLQRLLQLGRASGIYLICATQRPSNDIVSGTLKVNFTTRICFKVSNMYDSKTIINEKGAEYLNGYGDGLALVNGSFKLDRFQAFNPYTNYELLDILKTTKVS